jgi:hypothetical protein
VKRIVQPELLDALPPDDPRARQSRRDLQRLNSVMRHHACLTGALHKAVRGRPPERITELGAGDGHFLLHVAKSLAPRWTNVKVTMLDQQRTVTERTLAGFAALGWPAEEIVADALVWAEDPRSLADVVVTNLFLHHLQEAQLARLFAAIANRARLFVAVEPRRGAWPLFCSQRLWMLGCNTITRYDARLSVRAGFAGHELSALWPPTCDWEVTEASTGLFSHLFVARSKERK